MLQRTPRPRRNRGAVTKGRRARRGYSRKRRGVAQRSKLRISIVTVPIYQEDGFWFRH